MGISEGTRRSPGRRRSSYLWISDKVFILHLDFSPWQSINKIRTLQYHVKFHMNFMWNLQQNINVFPEIIRINDYRNILFSLNSQSHSKLFQTQKFCLFTLHSFSIKSSVLTVILYFKIKYTREVSLYCRIFKMHICPKSALCSVQCSVGA